MMNDFKLLYLCSRNHNESGCGSFFVRTSALQVQDNLNVNKYGKQDDYFREQGVRKNQNDQL